VPITLWLLETAALALSIFATTMLLWLGATVLLNGERRRPVVLLSSAGLLAAALFFLSHTMIIGRGFEETGSGMDFWWQLALAPLPHTPFAWMVAVTRYLGLTPQRRRSYQRWQIVLGVLGALIVPAFILTNPFPSYASLVYADAHNTDRTWWVAGAPIIIWLYLPYAMLCYLVPLAAIFSPPAEHAAYARARRWLVYISAALLGMGGLVFATMFWVTRVQHGPLALITESQRRLLFSSDLLVLLLASIATVLLGRVIVGFEVFTERALPRRGFFRQWRRTVLLIAAFAAAVALVARVQVRSIYGLIWTAALAALIFAVFSWRMFIEQDEFLAMLRPFVASAHLRERLLSGKSGDADIQQMFEALCRNVLDAQYACLVLDRDRTPHQIGYRWSDAAQAVTRLSLSDERDQAGRATLLLGPKNGGGDYAAEEIDVARAAIQRIVDMQAGEQVARLAMNLLRRRIAEVKVLGAQNRRVLHDEVLPQLHAAILRLEACGDPEAMAALTSAHKTLSAMIREMGTAAPERLEREGLLVALRRALEHDFKSVFESVEWRVSDPAARRIARDVPPFVGEVVFAAAQEALRNAARHARGEDAARPLRLSIELDWLDGLWLVVRDDGIGVQQESRGDSNGGTGSGLLFHSTMLAVVGGRMRVESAAGRGTSVIIVVPEQALTVTL
jgi:signal transduction histidine kinase